MKPSIGIVIAGAAAALLATATRAAESASAEGLRALAREGWVLEAQQQLIRTSRERELAPAESQLLDDLVIASHLQKRKLELNAALLVWKPSGEVKEGQYPWIVAVQVYDRVNEEWVTDCGGSLIGKRTVLTAAHCTEFPDDRVRIAYGSVDLRSADLKYARVADQEHHRDFKRVKMSVTVGGAVQPARGAVYDFGLIYTEVALDIEPLSPQGTSSTATPPWRVLGWGQSDLQNFPTFLAYGIVDPIDAAACKNVYSPLHESMLCAGNAQTTTNFCEGDSGGPLIGVGSSNAPSLIGIVSFTRKCEVPVGVYMKLEAGADWFTKLIRN